MKFPGVDDRIAIDLGSCSSLLNIGTPHTKGIYTAFECSTGPESCVPQHPYRGRTTFLQLIRRNCLISAKTEISNLKKVSSSCCISSTYENISLISSSNQHG